MIGWKFESGKTLNRGHREKTANQKRKGPGEKTPVQRSAQYQTKGKTMIRILRLLTIAVVIQIWTGAVIYAHGQVMAKDMLIRTPTVIAAITELHSHTHLGGMDKTEWSVVVRADGTPSKPYSSHDWSSNHLTVRIGSDLAIIHSHPDGTAPYPSQSDQNAAKQCHIPNYEISAYHIYVAEPDGKTVRKVADIEQGKHNTINIKWGAK